MGNRHGEQTCRGRNGWRFCKGKNTWQHKNIKKSSWHKTNKHQGHSGRELFKPSWHLQLLGLQRTAVVYRWACTIVYTYYYWFEYEIRKWRKMTQTFIALRVWLCNCCHWPDLENILVCVHDSKCVHDRMVSIKNNAHFLMTKWNKLVKEHSVFEQTVRILPAFTCLLPCLIPSRLGPLQYVSNCLPYLSVPEPLSFLGFVCVLLCLIHGDFSYPCIWVWILSQRHPGSLSKR